MSYAQTLAELRAAGDPTRLRLLYLLSEGEATVGELTQVLQQSQPRVSRHLKLLAQARLVTHFRDGQSVCYRLHSRGGVQEFLMYILGSANDEDSLLQGDRQRLAELRKRRESKALSAPSGPWRWAETGAERPKDDDLALALNEALGTDLLGDVLDIGSGSGTVLRLLGRRCRSAVGVDAARGMRLLARSRVQQAGLAHCTVREGDMHHLPFTDHAFDVVVLDEVLSLTDRPLQVLQEAYRVLRTSGRFLILDRIFPAARRLDVVSHRRCLYENQLRALLRTLSLKTTCRIWFPGRALAYALLGASAPAQLPTAAHG